ncbi:uncharacterized protein LOC120841334 [Ixodes scapularis]|uniref:uncharacterized protein LOC120841334 n=1 Tax=Ixodes scapularis TaxID=6945 RepID=UPI001C382AD8|nr:uncharacterized protein LOC120841334 [Ixodes scapularis]
MVFHKVWRCQHHPRNKVSERRNAVCMARLDVKIKKLSKGSKQNDPYLRRDVPLATVIRMDTQHSHNTHSADALRLLRGTRTTRQTFVGYFSDGMAVSEARRLHESKLCMEENGPELLANGALNPLARTVQHWHTVWRSACFGGGPIDALSKLEEKAPLYAAQGTSVTVSRSDTSSCSAVLVVTPIMRRAQALEAARDIVFIDSTSSCDTTKCTVTVVLVATMAGAVPLAVLLHNEQSTDGYSAAFKLLSGTHPLCFGGLSAPEVFMTDNSSAEKAALQETWPTARHLLCHFHVAQAEWRWLTAAHNGVHKDQRRCLMSAFQEVMYADTQEKLEAATAQLRRQPHQAFVARVEAFLGRQEEWVLLYRANTTTRGHNTNNFSEATIRVLKDIVLSRAEAFNAVALVDAVAMVWEKYFESRILRHAHSRVASHQVVYKRLLSKMPQGAAESIQPLGEKLYAVPSATRHDVVYEVAADFGACSCPVGKQGAFCKHQALVHETFGGWFPNAPPLTTEDRHRLGKLALGDKCPPWEFFMPFRGEQQYPGEEESPRCTPEAPKGPDNAEATDLLEANDQPEAPQPSTSALAPIAAQDPDQAQRAQAREEVYRRLKSRMRRLHAMNEENPAYIELLDALGDRMDRVTNGNDAYGFMLTLKAAAGVRQRRGRRIRVQPTSLARRRPGLTRGSKRVPAGRPSGQPSAKRPRKRAHSLQMSISHNVPSARLH